MKNSEEEIIQKGEDYIVVKDVETAVALSKKTIPSLKGRWIIVAPDGLEFVSREDIAKLPQIKEERQQLEQKHALEVAAIKSNHKQSMLVQKVEVRQQAITQTIEAAISQLREYHEKYPDADYYDIVGYLAGLRAAEDEINSMSAFAAGAISKEMSY